MRRLLGSGRFALLLCLGVAFLCPPAYPQTPIYVRMQKVVSTFVEQTGCKVVGSGSWIFGAKFHEGSDFDLRLLVEKGGQDPETLAKWRDAKQALETAIRAEFKEDAGAILAKTNLYAPSELMAGVENATDATERFIGLNTAPNLGHAGNVGAEVSDKAIEGLYGRGAAGNIRSYENATGRLFYKGPEGKCLTGLSELSYLGVPEEVLTVAGTANTAGQWSEKALKSLADGDGKSLGKYLERLERDLAKSASLAGTPLDTAYRTELSALRKKIMADPGALTESAEDVARLVGRGRAQASILRAMEDAGPQRQQYLQTMLKGLQEQSKLGQLFESCMSKLPSWANAENFANYLVICCGTAALSQSVGQGDDVFQTMSNVCGGLNPFVEIGPLLLGQVMSEIIVEARANGFFMAASFQEAWDLMDGIYTAWGRADVDPDPKRKLTLADAVARYQDEAKLDAFVYTQALRASSRNLGEANEAADNGVAEEIFARCWPTIRDAWRWQRDCLTSEYLKLGSEVVHTPLLIYYRPCPAPVKTQFTCEAASADRKLSERLDRMTQIIRILYGKGSGVAVSYQWTPAGAAVGERGWLRGFSYAAAGKYPIGVTLTVSPYSPFPKKEPRVMLQRSVSAVVEAVVGGAAELCPVCGKPVGTNPNCMHCILYKHDPTK